MTSPPEKGEASDDRAAYERWREVADPFWDEAEAWAEEASRADADE
ncbi:MAG: hypothetical protein WD225_03725 [Ilumatobacteraceae bacterium]